MCGLGLSDPGTSAAVTGPTKAHLSALAIGQCSQGPPGPPSVSSSQSAIAEGLL